MPRLSKVDRERAVTLLMQGQSQSYVANQLNVNQSTIHRLWRRLQTSGSTNDRPRSGRPRETTARQDRYIRVKHLRNRFRTAVETALETPGRHNNRIHPKTVRNRLREHGIKPYRPYKGMPLTEPRRAVRRDWLDRHRPHQFPRRQWQHVLFSDESRFSLFRADGRKRVYRRKNERYADACVLERDRYGGGSIMVWGAIAHGFKSPLVEIEGSMTAIKYRDEVLTPYVIPITRQNAFTFQQDNARPHKARVCVDYLAQNAVPVLDWPPYSPDLSPIEHLWDELDRRIRQRANVPVTKRALSQALREEWDNIPMATVNKLVRSMTNRIRDAIVARGGHTRY